MSFVRSNLCCANIVDARPVEMYFGIQPDFITNTTGHIKNAVSLPFTWSFTVQDGIFEFKNNETLKQIFKGVLKKRRARRNKNSKTIVYCSSGGANSILWYIYSQVLGYKKVYYYDGSMQEWVQNYNVVPFQWY